MKRIAIAICVCAMLVFNLVVAGPVWAEAIAAFSLPGLPLADVSKPSEDLLAKLETEILPQLESILTPEQREQFTTAVGEGTSFRKAFKALTLTPAQKSQLKALFQSLPKKDAFASLTPEQKRQLFLKKKEFFMPTSEEIADKIKAGMKNKETFAPTPEEIGEKIDAGLKMIKSKLED